MNIDFIQCDCVIFHEALFSFGRVSLFLEYRSAKSDISLGKCGFMPNLAVIYVPLLEQPHGPIAFREALPAATRLTLFSDDKPARFRAHHILDG